MAEDAARMPRWVTWIVLVWPVLLTLGAVIVSYGQRTESVAENHAQIERLTKEIASLQTFDGRLRDTIEKNRAEDDAQIRELHGQIRFQNGVINGLEEALRNLERRVSYIEHPDGDRR